MRAAKKKKKIFLIRARTVLLRPGRKYLILYTHLNRVAAPAGLDPDPTLEKKKLIKPIRKP